MPCSSLNRLHPDLAELYRTLIFYLREHRVSVAPILEIAIVTSVNDLNLLGPTSSPLMIFAITGLLLVGASSWRWIGGSPVSTTTSVTTARIDGHMPASLATLG